MRLKLERYPVAVPDGEITTEQVRGERYELPAGWAWARLGEVVSVGSTQVLPKQTPDQHFNYLALDQIETGTGRILNLLQREGWVMANVLALFLSHFQIDGPEVLSALDEEWGRLS